jgi:hypothetical protein
MTVLPAAFLQLTLALLPVPPDDVPRPGDPPAAAPEASLARLPADLGRTLWQEPPQVEPPPPRTGPSLDPEQQEGELPFIDLDWLEINPRLGITVFSEDYFIDPSFSLSFLAHAPVPFLAPPSNPSGEYFGIFAELSITPIQRTIEPELDTPDGIMILATLGIDYTIYRDQTWLFMLQAGFQYGTYGGVSDLLNGFSPIVGLVTGANLSKGLKVSYSPEYVIGQAGDYILLNFFGLVFEF